MTTLIDPPSDEGATGTAGAAGDYALRVVDDGSSAIPIGHEPVTIGAGPRCGVRLAGGGLKPLCCVVSRNAQGVVARRWSDGVTLNGEPFTESVLGLGDRLWVGGFEIVVEHPGAPESDAPLEAAPTDIAAEPPLELEQDTTVERLRSRLARRQATCVAIVAELRRLRAESTRREAEAVDRVEQLHDRFAALDARLTEESNAADALRADLAVAQQRIEELEAQAFVTEASPEAPESFEPTDEAPAEPEWATEPVAEASDASAHAADVEATWPASEDAVATEADLEEIAHEATEAPTAEPDGVAGGLWGIEKLAAEEAEQPQAYAEGDATPLETSEPETTPPEAAEPPLWDVAPEATDGSADASVDAADAEPIEANVVAITPTDTAAEAPVAEAPVADAVVAETVVVEAAPDAPMPEEPPAEAAEESRAQSFYERYAHLLPADDEDDAPEPTPPVPTEAVAEGAIAEPTTDDEESIDDYLKKMMDRIRGDSAPSAPVAAPHVAQPAEIETVEAAAVESEAAIAAPDKAPTEGAAPEPLRDLSELRTGDKPKSTANIGELRSLANQSARFAIGAADVNQTREQAKRQSAVAGVAVICGVVACATAPVVFGWQTAVGVGGIVIGSQLGTQTLRELKRMTDKNRPPEDATIG